MNSKQISLLFPALSERLGRTIDIGCRGGFMAPVNECDRYNHPTPEVNEQSG